MNTSTAITPDTDLAIAPFEVLRSVIKGDVLLPANAGYDEARTVWNGMIDKRPAVIVRCIDTNDVIQAVKFGDRNNLVVSIKGGGHNVAGNAVCEGGLMIEFSRMKEIKVDVLKSTATAQPGVLWKEFDEATQKHGLATTGGTVSHTGIAGLTLGGGLGWLVCKHGTTSDNLISVEIVTAKGEFLQADTDNNPDLFWAIRGGGGNFGVVTLFKYQLHRVGPTFMAGMILYPMDQAKAVMQNYRDHIRKAPDELMSYAGFIVTPDGLPVAAILPAWMGTLEDAEKHLAPLRSFGSPLIDLVSEIPYSQLQSIIDAAAPPGIRRYWKSGHFTELSDELIDRCLHHVTTRPSPFTPVLFFHVRGAAVKIDPSATAFVHRKDHWDFSLISQWLTPDDDEKNLQWTREFWTAIEPLANGVYVNHLDSDDSEKIKTAYGENFEKLKAIKKKYDPHNFFRMNNNILPA